MNMKKIISWGMMLAAAFTLTNCAKEIDAPVQEPESVGYPFEIVASTVDTKTVNDGMSTLWAEGDKINLFHALGDETNYVNDGAFTVADVEAGVFTGTIKEELDVEEEYDWFALYPYSEQVTTPAATTAGYTYIGHSKGLNQTGYNSTASLKGSVCPLYGVLKYGGVKPVIEMNHLTSVLAINVTNDTDEPLTITTASFTAPEEIVGSFYIDFTDKDNVVYNASQGYTQKTAVVNVTEGTALENGESAILYLAIKPFTAAAGEKLTLAVNGYSKEITLSKDAVFTAGMIKTVNFSYDATEAPAGPAAVTVAEFLKKTVSTTEWYQLTGIISNIYNTQYGNFYLTDATGTITVYGLKESETAGKTTFANLGLKEGYQVTLIGNRSEYNSTAQVGNAYYVSHIACCLAPVITCVDNVVTIEAESGVTIYYTTNGDEPTLDSFVYDEPFGIEETTMVNAIAVAEGKLNSGIASRNCVYVDPNAGGDSEEVAPVGTVLWAENWGTEGSGSTAFTDNFQLSKYTYSGRSGFGENATNVTYTSDSSNNVRVTKSSGTNCTGGHLWFNKSQAGELVTSEIKLYGATTLEFSHSQGTSSSLCQSFYSVDGGSTWVKLGENSGNIAKKSYSFTVSVGTASIKIKLAHPSSNSKNTRVDNLTLTVK